MYGTFWMSYGLFLIPGTGIMAAYTPGEFRSAIGIYFMAWMMVTIFFGYVCLFQSTLISKGMANAYFTALRR